MRIENVLEAVSRLAEIEVFLKEQELKCEHEKIGREVQVLWKRFKKMDNRL